MGRQTECVYCGRMSETTQEHVIPTCLFKVANNTPRPSDPVTVQACGVCNTTKSKDDDYLRDMLVIDEDCSDSPTAQAILKGKMIRSLRRRSSLVGRSAVRNARLEPIHTAGGIYIGHAYAVPLESERVQRIFKTIVHGLYYWVRKVRLPADCKFDIIRVRRQGITQYWQDLTTVLNAHWNVGSVGQGVFDCTYCFIEEDPRVTCWMLCFYQGVYIRVLTK